ncbi:hypothetical protein WDZ17_00560 [Pseudokineococcus basanitobsidens]|uniref:Uncharacterized protein n=1 Tax=Pseudokineococcus basanitobsidens TaxID=1926649 RepID=A0ABU8RFD3_9ACTN
MTTSPASSRVLPPHDRAVRVVLPEHPSGPALAACVRALRLALARGDVVVDAGAARGWPPGPQLVLERLRESARRRGRRWDERTDG